VKHSLLIGIDGGGTHSTAVAVHKDGRVAAVAYGDGLNFHNVGVDAVRRRLEEMVRDLMRQTGEDVDCVCVGMSALDGPADEKTTALFTGGLFAPGQLDLQSDAYVALMGFTHGESGMIVICGTGSMLVLMDKEGRQHVSGGWGYLLGDAGSGYTLSREALLAVIDESDGLGEKTILTDCALSYFNATHPRALIDRIYDPACTPDRLAGFARHVIKAAEENDPCARRILKTNMERLARHAAELLKKDENACRIGLYGGIFAHSELARADFAAALERLAPRAQLCPIVYPPELGAVIHLMRARGLLTPAALDAMQSTYKEIKS